MRFKGIFSDRENVLYQYTVFLKWLCIAVCSGIFIGVVCSLFHMALDKVTQIRTANPFLVMLLPLGGVVIVWLYKLCGMDNDHGTNGIIKGARGEEKVSIKTAPLIFIATLITHLLGGSAGREGAALQLGGSLISPLRKPLKLNRNDYSMLIMCGMAAGFSALFGTPAAAAVFAIEVTVVGIAHYSAIVPCLLSSLTAAMVADWFHVKPTSFLVRYIPEFHADSYFMLARTIIMGIAGAIVSIVFCKIMSKTAELYKKYIKNPYLRILAGGAIVAAISMLIYALTGSFDYNGAGTDIIKKAFYRSEQTRGIHSENAADSSYPGLRLQGRRDSALTLHRRYFRLLFRRPAGTFPLLRGCCGTGCGFLRCYQLPLCNAPADH